MRLNQLQYPKGAVAKKIRKARGPGSGKGKTAGRGHKGQKSRAGVAIKGFEGGQMPLYRRLPKRGFNQYKTKEFNIINLQQIQQNIENKKIKNSQNIDIKTLVECGLVGKVKLPIKILAIGEIKQKIIIEAHRCSENAREKIKKLGGEVKVISSESRSTKIVSGEGKSRDKKVIARQKGDSGTKRRDKKAMAKQEGETKG